MDALDEVIDALPGNKLAGEKEHCSVRRQTPAFPDLHSLRAERRRAALEEGVVHGVRSEEHPILRSTVPSKIGARSLPHDQVRVELRHEGPVDRKLERPPEPRTRRGK